MTGQGTVVSILGNSATVLVRKTSACSHDCTECSTCTAPEYKVTVLNPIGAKVGDKVLIEAKSSKVLSIALCVYILPVFLMLLAVAFCDAMSFSHLTTTLIFLFMLALWAIIIRKVNRLAKMQNVIVSVIKD